MAVPDIWFTDVYEDQHASPAAALCQLSGRDYDPAIAYDRSGNATVVWAHQGTANGKFSIYYSRRTSTAWSPPAALCPGAQSALYHNIDPAVAFDENGRGICVWVRVCEPPGDRNELYYSVWNGSGWSDSAAVYRLPPGADPYDTTFRYPEIAFTKSGQAVVVAVAKGNPLDPNAKPAVVCIPRSGSGWAAPTCVAGSEGAFGPKYSLPSEPARLRLSVAPDNQQDRVHVRWQKLYGGVWGTTGTSVSGTWTWSAPTQFSTGGPGAGTVVAGDGTTVKTVYGRGSHLWDETGHLPPDPYGPTGIRPSGAWLSGTTPGAIAVWHGFGGRIGWSFWNAANGSWLGPIPIPTPGIYQFNLNPDVAAKSGSHTMPPQQ
jgi:hypothetical protein